MRKIWMNLPVITLAGFLLSCNIINPAEDIPAYIRVDTILVKVTNFNQGSASHNMTCVKLYVAGTALGFFEMPAMVPSLLTGPQSVIVYPGFELNGITGSREIYPFFEPYIGTGKTDLVQGEVITISPVTTYKKKSDGTDACKFPWMEDFEDAGVSFLYPAYSDTAFQIQNDTVREGRFSGAIYLDRKHRFFEAYSGTDFEFPILNSNALVEFDYLSNTLLEFGVYILQDGAGVWTSLLFIRPVDHWNRIYIDLHTTLENNYLNAELYRPGFRAGWDSTGMAKQVIFMDNLKLIHF